MQPLLTADDLAKIFNVSSRTILNWYYDGIIPARIRVGKVIRFELDAVMTALEKINEVPRANEFWRRRRTK